MFSGGSASLIEYLKSRIRMSGPISVHTFMKEALTNSKYGYYMTRDVFGQDGDFITSPEITQIFGELIGIWIVNEWANLGQCKTLNVVELGPGRGTLASDILRVFRNFPEVCRPCAFHLVEVSPVMASLQEAVLRGQPLPRNVKPVEAGNRSNVGGPYKEVELATDVSVKWYQRLNDVPAIPACFVAHEFFDALPIHKFQKQNGVWREVLVSDCSESGGLKFVLSSRETPASKMYVELAHPEPHRQHLEISPEAGIIMEEVSSRLTKRGGVALIADYGHSGEKEDTFRAFRNHQLTDPLQCPGECDLTADVDFKYLLRMCSRISRQVDPFGPVTQASFLNNMGLGVRLQVLLRNSSKEERRMLISGCEKLVSTREMGHRFKFLALRRRPDKSESDYRPAGFPIEDGTIV